MKGERVGLRQKYGHQDGLWRWTNHLSWQEGHTNYFGVQSDTENRNLKNVGVACIFSRLVVCQLLHLLLSSPILKAVFSPC